MNPLDCPMSLTPAKRLRSVTVRAQQRLPEISMS